MGSLPNLFFGVGPFLFSDAVGAEGGRAEQELSLGVYFGHDAISEFSWTACFSIFESDNEMKLTSPLSKECSSTPALVTVLSSLQEAKIASFAF